jgi:hypothetical protein
MLMNCKIIDDELKMICKEVVVASFIYYPDICLYINREQLCKSSVLVVGGSDGVRTGSLPIKT